MELIQAYVKQRFPELEVGYCYFVTFDIAELNEITSFSGILVGQNDSILTFDYMVSEGYDRGHDPAEFMRRDLKEAALIEGPFSLDRSSPKLKTERELYDQSIPRHS